MLHRCPSVLAATLLAFSAARPAAAVDPPGAGALVDPDLGPRVAAAVADAASRLEEPACAAVLGEFTDDRTGLTLAEKLAASGRSASQHVAALVFRASPGLRPLGSRRVLAFTVPESRVVWLGREELLRVQNQHRLVTAVVLHEVLHTLGLRDDHPSSVAITERVLARCF